MKKILKMEINIFHKNMKRNIDTSYGNRYINYSGDELSY